MSQSQSLPEDLEWVRIFWVNGATKMLDPRAVKDPPCNGWQSALVIKREKRSTIFCPYSYESFVVPNDCAELRTAEPAEFRREWFVDFMTRQWNEFQSRGWQRDYDTAALVFRTLGLKAPEQLMKGGEEDTRVKGGKEVESELKKPVRRSGKRGKFLAWFLDDERSGSASVREAMAEFGMTRSNALSYLYMLQKDHGIGYALVGDTVTIQLPEGCESPFDDDDDGEA